MKKDKKELKEKKLNNKHLFIIGLVLGLVFGIAGSFTYVKLQDNKDDEKIQGTTLANPVAGLSFEDALKNAIQLGEGTNMTTYRTMTYEEYLLWWSESNPGNEELVNDVIEMLRSRYELR